MTQNEIILNEANKRFELKVDGQIAFITYILKKDNIIFLTHTEVPAALEGNGIGSDMVKKTLEYIKQHNQTVAPVCSFVAGFISKHPEWKTSLAKGYSV